MVIFVIILLVVMLLVVVCALIYKHFVKDQIMDIGGMVNRWDLKLDGEWISQNSTYKIIIFDNSLKLYSNKALIYDGKYSASVSSVVIALTDSTVTEFVKFEYVLIDDSIVGFIENKDSTLKEVEFIRQ